MSMSIDKVIEILDSGKAPETEQDFEDFDTAIETAINLVKTYLDNHPNDPLTLEHIRHGRWLKNTRFKQERRACSECGFDSAFEFNFCPNCGAQMDLTGDDWHA